MYPAPSLGILQLDFGLPAASVPSAAYRDPSWVGLPVILETVPGAWVENVLRGDPELAAAYVAAACRLVDRGAVAICSDCGFSLRYQEAVASAVKIPVAMSSLLLIPALLRQLPKSSKLGILTADARQLDDDLLGVRDPEERSRIVIDGIQDGEVMKLWLERPTRTSAPVLEKEVLACAGRLQSEHPDVGAFLFECTAFTPFTPAVRRQTKLPVYAVDTITRMTAASLRSHSPVS